MKPWLLSIWLEKVNIMEQKTAQNIVKNLIDGKLVKLRKNQYNGISKQSWDAICNVLFTDYNVTSVNVNYENFHGVTLGHMVAKQGEKHIFSNSVRLY